MHGQLKTSITQNDHFRRPALTDHVCWRQRHHDLLHHGSTAATIMPLMRGAPRCRYQRGAHLPKKLSIHRFFG
jgi:hypothetical protein